MHLEDLSAERNAQNDEVDMTMKILKMTALATLIAAGSTVAFAQDSGNSGSNAGNNAASGNDGSALGGAPATGSTGSDGTPGGTTANGATSTVQQGEGDSVGKSPQTAPCPEGYNAKDDGTCAEANLQQ